MFRFVEIRDGKAIFTGGVFSEETPFSRDEIEAEILDMADRLEEVNPNAPYLPDLRSGFEEFRKAQKSFEALDSAAQAPQPPSAAPTRDRRFVFKGTSYGFRGIKISEVLGGQDFTKYSSIDPKTFAALLPECHPDSIGAVRAAMKVAELVQMARSAGKDPYSVVPREVRVFAGVDRRLLGEPRARFDVYDVSWGDRLDGQTFSHSLDDLQNRSQTRLGLDRSEIQAAIAALEGADLSCAVMLGVSNSSPERAMSARPSVQFLRVATGTKGGVHAEGVFCPADAKPSQAQKDYLTAAQIRGRLEGTTQGHPDRAVYEQALKGVEARNVALQEPIRVPG